MSLYSSWRLTGRFVETYQHVGGQAVDPLCVPRRFALRKRVHIKKF